jgi:hypothetical protein
MISIPRRLLLLACGLLGAALAGCRDNNVKSAGCQQDSECGSPASAYKCEVETGACLCRTNQACLATEFCNGSGFCQDRAGCEKNADCLDDTTFCDTSTGSCIPLGRCSTDLQCALGQVCDRSQCVDGCRTDGDCEGVSCRCGDGPCTCDGGADCAVGVCDGTFCSSERFCRYGEVCTAQPDSGVPYAQCDNDFDPLRRPYCANCSFGGGDSLCGTGPNFCLIDTQNPGNYYCGVDCSEGQACPRGYGCQDVIVVGGGALPQCNAQGGSCPQNPNLPCGKDEDCPRGGACVKAAGAPNGYCAGQCAANEGDPIGYCTCLVDSDCAQETCSAGRCTISKRSCVNDTDCRTIRCVDFNGVGGCLIGQNCAPDDGLSCLQVR